MHYKSYFYYSKHDSQKTPIDRVKILDMEDALNYFAGRKHMEKYIFLNLYTIEIDETKSK